MLLFDLTATQPLTISTKRHGGGKYGEAIIKRIVERNLPVKCYYDSRKWINPDIVSIIGEANLYDISSKSLSEAVKETGASLIYSALPQRTLTQFTECQIIGTVHGLRRLETPADLGSFRYKNNRWQEKVLTLFHYLLPKAYVKYLCNSKMKEWSNPNYSFVTVSNHSANSIKVFFPSLRNRNIPVFYSPSTSTKKEIEKKYTEKYFLLVSGNRPDKNNLRAINALDKLFGDGYLSDFNVKITGVKSADAYRYTIKNIEKFDFKGYVDEDELEQLYHDAYALIYPSLNEGFGYPPLETMHYGVPVLASPFTSIPEVCEGSVLYFNPFSIEEIAARVLYVTQEVVHKKYSDLAIAQFSKITAKQDEDLDKLIDYIYDNV